MSKKRKKHGYAERLKYMHMLENGFSQKYIEKHFGINHRLLGYLWARYQSEGAAGLIMKKNVKADYAFKLQVVRDIEENHLTLVSAALKYNMCAGQIRVWRKIAQTHGYDALATIRPRGRPPKSDMGIPRKKKPEEMTELERLRYEAFRINVWIDGPWANETWKGKQIGTIEVPAGSDREVTRFTIDVAEAVDNLGQKHAIYLVAEGEGDLCELIGLGFSKKGQKMNYPAPPEVTIAVDGNVLDMPEHPVRSTNENGYVGYDRYEACYTVPAGQTRTPKVKAWADNKAVRIEVTQPESVTGRTTVKCTYNGIVKTYTVVLSE